MREPCIWNIGLVQPIRARPSPRKAQTIHTDYDLFIYSLLWRMPGVCVHIFYILEPLSKQRRNFFFFGEINIVFSASI